MRKNKDNKQSKQMINLSNAGWKHVSADAHDGIDDCLRTAYAGIICGLSLIRYILKSDKQHLRIFASLYQHKSVQKAQVIMRNY